MAAVLLGRTDLLQELHREEQSIGFRWERIMEDESELEIETRELNSKVKGRIKLTKVVLQEQQELRRKKLHLEHRTGLEEEEERRSFEGGRKARRKGGDDQPTCSLDWHLLQRTRWLELTSAVLPEEHRSYTTRTSLNSALD